MSSNILVCHVGGRADTDQLNQLGQNGFTREANVINAGKLIIMTSFLFTVEYK